MAIENNRMQQIKDWWQSDTAKAVSTIIAVLLIPAAVLAWNYASSRDTDNDNTNSDSVISDTDESGIAPVEDTDEDIDDSGIVPQTTGTATPTATPVVSNNQTDSGIGGIDEVDRLPATSAAYVVNYSVKKGDNVYKISKNVCGNISFYVNNENMDYLKVGQVISVECN